MIQSLHDNETANSSSYRPVLTAIIRIAKIANPSNRFTYDKLANYLIDEITYIFRCLAQAIEAYFKFTCLNKLIPSVYIYFALVKVNFFSSKL